MDDITNMIHDIIAYFNQLHLASQPSLTADITPFYPKTTSASSTTTLLLPISNVKIKTTLLSIPDNKALGSDGFNAFLFKKCW